jgi:hypothetical protein
MIRVLCLLAFVAASTSLLACAPGLSAACLQAAENNACPECYDGDTTCTYGDISVTEASCQECQARVALLDALCEAGVMDDADTLETGTECATVRDTQ